MDQNRVVIICAGLPFRRGPRPRKDVRVPADPAGGPYRGHHDSSRRTPGLGAARAHHAAHHHGGQGRESRGVRSDAEAHRNIRAGVRDHHPDTVFLES